MAPPKAAGTHTTPTETHPWSVFVADHPQRADSRWFTAAKRTAKKILATFPADGLPYGPAPWEMHHGGSLWVRGHDGWRIFLARAGIEWSMQFCADPVKVDRLRQDAATLVRAFPDTLPALEKLGYADAPDILSTPIKTADDVARYTDSLFNSCVPLSRTDHQGILPAAAGEHHYPLPVKAGDFIRYDDFPLWVTLDDGTHVAVTPVSPRGQGDGRVRMVFARHGTSAGDAVALAQEEHKAVILPDDHPVAREAFKQQTTQAPDAAPR
ncbi:DUF6424 family protein [Amycolatopsis panacis]|uniref:Uncharacterized protein n=1 Tax=Amycolatopsis panacis TaxID=2340917 RepID=A0A419HX94_9PSEU|nr:DUF6424 family protein [Amycolatopsis panacis]RJQ81621.1 hypothetical protein D5S19_23085 [Amycolatopsis panacis]